MHMVLKSAGHQPKGPLPTAALDIKSIPERNLSDEEFSWCMTDFHVWAGEHCPLLKRQADMGLAIRTTDDDTEEHRTS